VSRKSPHSRPEFFVDRSLGRHHVPDALRKAGWRLRTHVEVFGERDEQVTDVEWLEYCGREGLIVLAKDRRLRYRPNEIAVIRAHKLKAFVLSRGHLKAADQIKRFLDNAERIEEACSDPGPFIYSVQARRIVRLALSDREGG
jgi:predicted nuclease of predicted toxin-antitoxin system